MILVLSTKAEKIEKKCVLWLKIIVLRHAIARKLQIDDVIIFFLATFDRRAVTSPDRFLVDESDL